MGKALPTNALALAREIKAVIATENLHVLCLENSGEIVPLERLVDDRDKHLQHLSFCWHPDAEMGIAKVVKSHLVEAECSSLQDVSSDALMLELKRRSDLFFCVMTPAITDDWEWRRSYKGGHAWPLLGFVKLHLDAMSQKWAKEGEMTPRDDDVTDHMDDQSPEEGAGEGSPGDRP
jgi:hypothetical protein